MSNGQNSAYYLKVAIGESATQPDPIPLELAQALSAAEVIRSDRAPSGFQLTFNAAMSMSDNDYGLLTNPLLQEFNRVVLTIVVGSSESMLIDGFITTKEVNQQAGKIVVTGEDISVKMDLFQVSKSYPNTPDSSIVSTILGRYSTFGISSDVQAPPNEVTPVEYTPQQLSTDREYLLKLAKRHGVCFYLKFGSSPTAYWGPQERSGTAQPALTSNAVMFGNVESLEPQYSALAAELNYGTKLTDGDGQQENVDTPFAATGFTSVELSKIPAPLQEFASLAADPSSYESQLKTLKVKGKYLPQQIFTPENVGSAAQGATNLESSQAATVKGELDTAVYGHVLQAPGVVGVRGAGATFDGDYYIQSVTHKLNLQPGALRYKQSFVLTREGQGSKETSV